MGDNSAKKEMLFVLGQFFNKTNRRFSKLYLDVSVSKAEFIDVIKGMNAASKTERALYRNLETLQKEKYLVYNDRKLQMTKKGFAEYDKTCSELERLKMLSYTIEKEKIKFKRKTQTRLKV